MPDDFSGQLCLDNLFDREWKGRGGTAAGFQSKHLDLDPCYLEPVPPIPTQQRVEAVTAVYSDGSQAPITYGVPIDWNATYRQLADGVRQLCDLPEDKQVVLVLLEYNRFRR